MQTEASQLLDVVSQGTGVAKGEVALLSVMLAALLVICCLLAHVCFCKDQLRIRRRRHWSKGASRTVGAKAGHVRLPAEVLVPEVLNGNSEGSDASNSDDLEEDDGKGVGDRRMVPYGASSRQMVPYEASRRGVHAASEPENDVSGSPPLEEDGKPQAAEDGKSKREQPSKRCPLNAHARPQHTSYQL